MFLVLPFRYLTYFQFIFVYSVRKYSSLIDLSSSCICRISILFNLDFVFVL